MIASFLLLGATEAFALARPVGDPACRYDRQTMIALSEQAFDQDMGGGWRTLSDRGCDATAADLIAAYRVAHPALRRPWLSYWHEGQLRAIAGQIAPAIALFERAYKPKDDDARYGWNLYVEGSIAFLRGDRAALETARGRLALLPLPPEMADAKGPDGKPVEIAWPMNLNVLDGFLRCFGKSYRIAYDAPCSQPMTRVTKP